MELGGKLSTAQQLERNRYHLTVPIFVNILWKTVLVPTNPGYRIIHGVLCWVCGEGKLHLLVLMRWIVNWKIRWLSMYLWKYSLTIDGSLHSCRYQFRDTLPSSWKHETLIGMYPATGNQEIITSSAYKPCLVTCLTLYSIIYVCIFYGCLVRGW